jgi:hypothetical protein
VLSGNSHDRIQFGSKEDNAGSGDGAAGKDKVSSLYGLNEACLMEVRGWLLASPAQGVPCKSCCAYIRQLDRYMEQELHPFKVPASVYVWL